jgi:hypothetical protein
VKLIWKQVRSVHTAIFLISVSSTSIVFGLFFGDRFNQLSNRLPGSTYSDSGFLAGRFVSMRESGLNPFAQGKLMAIGWPSGINNRAPINYTAPLSVLVNFYGFAWAGPIAQHLLFSILGVLVSGICVAAVVRKHTNSYSLAMAASVATVAGSPMLHWAQEAPNYAYVGMLILFMDYACEAVNNASKRNITKSIGLFLICFWWLQYFALFSVFILFSVVVVSIAQKRRVSFDFLAWHAVALFVGIMPYIGVKILLPSAVPNRLETDRSPFALNLKEILSTDSYFYIGRAIAISFCGFFILWTSKKLCSKTFLQSLSCVVWSGLVTTVFCFLFLGNWNHEPFQYTSQLISTLVPQFRHGKYSAHLIQMILIVCICELIQRTNKRWFVVPLLALTFSSLTLIDGMRQDFSGGDRLLQLVKTPLAVEILTQYPKGPVANFPWELSSEFGSTSDATPCLRQAVTHQPVVNVCDYDEPPTRLIQQVQLTSSCNKLGILRSAGVKYLIVDFSSNQPALMNCIELNRSVQLLAYSDDVTVWQFLSSSRW